MVQRRPTFAPTMRYRALFPSLKLNQFPSAKRVHTVSRSWQMSLGLKSRGEPRVSYASLDLVFWQDIGIYRKIPPRRSCLGATSGGIGPVTSLSRFSTA